MFSAEPVKTKPHEFSRCEERIPVTGSGIPLSSGQQTDAAIKDIVMRALWDDDVLRAVDYHEIDVHVKNGVLYLSGHIMSSSSQGRINNAISSIPGISKIQNNLVLDDNLTLDVASSLAELEYAQDCKFFIGTAHGVVSVNGIVKNENIKLLAEKRISDHPSVRGVINNIHVTGHDLKVPNQPFQQPTIGEVIYFLDGIAGRVKQVIVNPNNRRVIAMTVLGKPVDLLQAIKPLGNGESQSQDRLLVIRMSSVRYITRVSGFLYISSKEKNRYLDFDPSHFSPPEKDWTPPYPYCPRDVLIPVKYQSVDTLTENEPQLLPFGAILEDASTREQYFATDSFGL